MTTPKTNDVVAIALAEVARARAFRERAEAERKRVFGAIPLRQSVYVLAYRKAQADAACRQ
jgi:hypothetical protein